MKYIACLFIIACTIYSCSNEDVKTAQASDPSLSPDSIKQAFVPFVRGTWIADEYYQAIFKTRSPMKAYDKVGFFTGLIVEDENWKDSLYISANLGNHEGTNFTAYYSPGHTAKALPTNIHDYEGKIDAYELGYEIENKDTFLILYSYKNNAMVHKRKFRRVVHGSPGTELSFGVEYTINKLFAGDYTYTDATGNIHKVTFTKDGSVKGFDYFNTYDISYDFGDGGHGCDVITFGTESEPAYFNFEFEGNKLNIYWVDQNDNTGQWSRTTLAHQLTRTIN